MNKDYFHINEVNPQELSCVLLEHFSEALGGYKFQRRGVQHFLEVTYDEAGNIRNIQPSKDFPTDELEEIEKKIHDNLLTVHGTKVCKQICFCDSKITGYLRYKDLFQILPMPDDATKPNIGITTHPFLLEVSYEFCPIPMIDTPRRREKAIIYTRLLNLLSDQVISPGSRYGQFGWTLKTDDPSNVYSEWAQLGYVYPGLKGTLD